MALALYDELTPWYRLLDPIEDHALEAGHHAETLKAAITGPAQTLLELGAGAGNNAFFLKAHFRCTLTDLSEAMLDLSRKDNPDCEHLVGDMRTLRLGRTFDAVLIHDAIVYMTTEADLRAAMRTAFDHLRPGGAAVFAPDCVQDTFHELTEHEANDAPPRGIRGLCWMYDPDPSDTSYVCDYAFLLRDGADVKLVHDRHVEGLFPDATWARLMQEVGFEVERSTRPIEDQELADAYVNHVFVGRRPA